VEALKEGCYYHIYNRGAGRNKLFFDKSDYRVFLKKYGYYLSPVVETFAWCLIENHFHFLFRMKTVQEQLDFFESNRDHFKTGFYHGKISPEKNPFLASKQISHLMNSYTRYINRKKNRSGTLIEGPFKRIRIVDELNLLNLICYIHRNPIHHNIVKNYPEYPYSSFHDYTKKRESFIEIDQVISRFGGMENFKQAHAEFRLKVIPTREFLLE